MKFERAITPHGSRESNCDDSLKTEPAVRPLERGTFFNHLQHLEIRVLFFFGVGYAAAPQGTGTAKTCEELKRVCGDCEESA
ncbi:hypothetical protein TNCV_4237431 [Trichonephila clavipes]|nr:hypothetical protein TNCV_4237431 [Trichonephila clavipes]